ncbi:MAG: redoxin family protein [Planctomycetota bacterium]
MIKRNAVPAMVLALFVALVLTSWQIAWTQSSDPGASPPPTDAAPVRQAPRVLKPSDHGVGRLVPDVAFTDLKGKQHKLSDFADRKALVVALTGTGCPLCLKYAPTLAELEKRYRGRSVAFVFVNPNESEPAEKLKQAIETHGFEGPYVRDVQEVLTRALGARTTTEVFLLDAARTLVYRGAVDDQYGFGYALDAPRHTYLADALEALLGGREPAVAATTSPGCELFFDARTPPAETPAVTYHNRISRIVQNNCMECHREGGLAPFSLEKHEDVKDYAEMIRYVVEQQIMPPWFAAPHEPADEEKAALRWANDRSLSPSDRADLLAWIKAGAPEGDPRDAPLPRSFPEDWMIGEPDLVVQIPEPIAVKATGRMPYQYVRVQTSFPEDRWVQAVEVQPTSRAVVHHVLVFVQEGRNRDEEIDERTGFFAGYVPGNSHQRYPEGFAKKLPAGAALVFQLHYTPNGTATTDQTRLGLVLAKEPPRHIVRNVGIANRRISIPPGASNHAERAVLPVPADVVLLAFMPHMHLRGKAFRYDLVLPHGDRQRLLDVPRYDFNWQLSYRLAEPLAVPRGSRIEVTGWFDNSAGNPANPDPSQTVRWGPQTEDEMLLGYVEFYVPSETPVAAELGAN